MKNIILRTRVAYDAYATVHWETDQVPDPVLRIRDAYPGSEFFSIPDPGSASKNLSILTQKNGFSALGCSTLIWILIFYPSRIPDPGVKKAPDPGSGSPTLPGSFIIVSEVTYDQSPGFANLVRTCLQSIRRFMSANDLQTHSREAFLSLLSKTLLCRG